MAYSYNQNPYMNYGNQYYQQQIQPISQIQPVPQMQQSIQQPVQQSFIKPIGLQGKSVDNIEVVKATDIPLDGSVSYFPLVDGSAIVTKQLMQDGTSRITVYKPTELDEKNEKPSYITEKELNEKIKRITPVDFSTDIKNIKKQLREITDDIDELKTKSNKE